MPDNTRKGGVVAAVVHELLKVEQFETLADLSEAVKCRCAALRLPYDAGAVSEAVRWVQRSRPVLVIHPPHLPEIRVEAAPISPQEAVRICRDICAKVQPVVPPHISDRPEHFPDLVLVPVWN